jgi:hypothetical protein
MSGEPAPKRGLDGVPLRNLQTILVRYAAAAAGVTAVSDEWARAGGLTDQHSPPRLRTVV